MIDAVNSILLGDLTREEVREKYPDLHDNYIIDKLLKRDFYLAGYDDLDYEYIRRKWNIRKEYYKRGWYRIMHPYYKKMFPDIKPPKLGRGWGKGMVTMIGKDGSKTQFSMSTVRNSVARILWNETLDKDFTLDKIRFTDAYNKVQYWDILRHNRRVEMSQSKFNQIMDALVTGISFSFSGMSLSPQLVRAGFSLAKVRQSAMRAVKVRMLTYRLSRMNKRVIPRNEFEMKTFKEYAGTFSKKAAPLDKGVPPLERHFICTQHRTESVRITRKRKVVTRVRFKGTNADKAPLSKDVKKIRRLNKGKVNIGPAKGMSTPKKLNAFQELKIRTPGKNYSMIHHGPALNMKRQPLASCIRNHRQYISELKAKYGLKRKHILRSRISISGAARALTGVRQPSAPDSSSPSDALGNNIKREPYVPDTPGAGMGGGTNASEVTPSKPHWRNCPARHQ